MAALAADAARTGPCDVHESSTDLVRPPGVRLNSLQGRTVTSYLAHLGRDNGNVFTRAEALDSGETDRSLQRALRSGLLVRLRRGVYVPAETYAACDSSGKHLLHARGALAPQSGQAVLTGTSAAALYGFALYEQDLSMVHLLRLDAGATRRAASANHHAVTRAVAVDEIVVHEGLAAVSPARAVWEVACRSSLEGGVVTIDSALHLDPDLYDRIEDLAARFAYFPGSRVARSALRLADGRSESAGESVSRVQFHRYGIPKPELQYPVHSARGHLIGVSDFYWEESRHLAEFDGKIKYLKYLRPNETPSDCVYREKCREDAMRADLSGMTRLVWSMVMPQQASRTMRDLALALEQSRRLYVRGRVIIAS